MPAIGNDRDGEKIAERLRMGTWMHVNRLLYWHRRDKVEWQGEMNRRLQIMGTDPFITFISRFQYGYNGAGNRQWVKRASGKGDIYKYDAINQLTNVLYEATNPNTTPSAWTNEGRYVFDAAGNRSSVTITNTGTTTYTANALNQYTSVNSTALTYDGNGNLTNDGSWTYTYDTENRLIKAVNGSTVISYVYDVLGRLIERDNASITNRFYYSGWQAIEERNGNDTAVRKYVYGPGIDEPVRMSSGKKYYYHADAITSVTAMTDSNGNIVEQYHYDVYGTPTIYDSTFNPQPSTTCGNRLMFQGRDRDPDTGLYNFRSRYYSPTLGRFMQPDPIRQRGGINLYTFVANNPGSKVDPLGLQFLEPPSQGTYGAWNDTNPNDLSDWNNPMNHYEPSEPNGDNPIDWFLSFFNPPPTPEQADWDRKYGPGMLLGPGPWLINVATKGMTERHPFESQSRSSFLESEALQPLAGAPSPCIHPNVSTLGPPTSHAVQVNPGKILLGSFTRNLPAQPS